MCNFSNLLIYSSLFNSYFQEKSFSETLKILSDYLDRSVFVLENYQLGQWYALSKKDTNSLKSQPPQLILLLDTIHRPLIDNYFDSLFQFLMIKNSISLFRNKSAILSVVLTGGVLRSFLLLHDHFYVGYFSFIPLPITADRFLFYQHPDLLLPISSLPS